MNNDIDKTDGVVYNEEFNKAFDELMQQCANLTKSFIGFNDLMRKQVKEQKDNEQNTENNE